MKLKDSNITCTFVSTGFPENRSMFYRKVGEDTEDPIDIETDDDNRYILGDHGNDVSECDVEDVKIELPDVVNSFAEINQPVCIRLIDNKNDSIIGENTAARSENEGTSSNENVKPDGNIISVKELQSSNKHERVHNTEKIFECTFCQKT